MDWLAQWPRKNAMSSVKNASNMTIRQKAAMICSVAASTPGFKTYGDVAIGLGFDVKCVGPDVDDFAGPDMKAVNLAAQAWLDVDGDALDLDGPNDPRRDAEAEAMILNGYKGWDAKD